MKKNLLMPVLLLLPVLILASCNREESEGKFPVSKNAVVLTIGGDEVLTKAAYTAPVMEPISLADENGELEGWVLTETITSMDDGLYDIPEEGPETKGTLVTTSNFYDQYAKDGKVAITVIDPTTGKEFASKPTSITFDKDKNKFIIEFADGVKWPESKDGECELLFFFDAPKGAASNVKHIANTGDGTTEFTYSDPTDIDSQVDLLFGSKRVSQSTKNSETVTLYHALTGVKFEIDASGYYDITGRTLVPPTITNITILGINDDGSCTVDPGDGKSKSNVVSDWTSTSGKADYSVECSTNENEVYLLLTPQEVAGKTVKIDFTIEGQPYSRTVTFPDNVVWKAGELHTYTLGITKVNVDVTDKMNSDLTQKTDVLTWNNGNAAEYVRATYSLAWYYGEGENAKIVAPYTETEATVTLSTANWIKGSDGFYYYKYPIQPGKHTNENLITSIVLANGVVAPFPKAHLEARILLQGVLYDSSKNNVGAAWTTNPWGDVKVAGSDNTVVSQLSNVVETPAGNNQTYTDVVPAVSAN